KVRAVNEVGPSLTFSQQQQHVTLGAPSGHVAGLTVQTTPGSGVVNVSWTALDDANWNDAATRTYRVTVVDPAGTSTNPGTCDVVADTQSPACSFTTATAGLYTLHVRAEDEVAPAADESTQSATVALVAPTGSVADLAVHTTLGSRVVTVTWSTL